MYEPVRPRRVCGLALLLFPNNGPLPAARSHAHTFAGCPHNDHGNSRIEAWSSFAMVRWLQSCRVAVSWHACWYSILQYLLSVCSTSSIALAFRFGDPFTCCDFLHLMTMLKAFPFAPYSWQYDQESRKEMGRMITVRQSETRNTWRSAVNAAMLVAIHPVGSESNSSQWTSSQIKRINTHGKTSIHSWDGSRGRGSCDSSLLQSTHPTSHMHA